MSSKDKQNQVIGTTTQHTIEDVETYPRPPLLEQALYPITITLGGAEIVSTRGAYRVLETFHPPTYYIPPEDVTDGALAPVSGSSMCEWKGPARYFDVTGGEKTAPRSAWCYPNPTPQFADIAGYLAFYCHPMDRCLVDGIEAMPQPGNFYGGWVTPWTVGAIKGAPGTTHW
ncbi:MAG: DUF427 domain-containing protein [Pseudomonadota bacterium]